MYDPTLVVSDFADIVWQSDKQSELTKAWGLGPPGAFEVFMAKYVFSQFSWYLLTSFFLLFINFIKRKLLLNFT